jgi:prevent-host-death family protein
VTTKITATEAKARLSTLLDRVQKGEEFEITRRGVTVARLAPMKGPLALKGLFAGVATTAAGDDELLSTGAPWELR